MANVKNSQLVDQAGIEAKVIDYLAKTKNWRSTDFRLEWKGDIPDGQCVVLWAIPHADELEPEPGGGEAVELHVEKASGHVLREYGFQ